MVCRYPGVQVCRWSFMFYDLEESAVQWCAVAVAVAVAAQSKVERGRYNTVR